MSATATLVLDRLWLNLLSTGDSVAAYGQLGRSSSFGVEGSVRTYAGGRQRGVFVAGEKQTYKFVLQDVTLTQRDTLREWIGQNVIVRDHRGQVFFGTYFAVDVAERFEWNLYEIAITILGTTTPEGV